MQLLWQNHLMKRIKRLRRGSAFMRGIVRYQWFSSHGDSPRTTENQVERAIERAIERARDGLVAPEEIAWSEALHTSTSPSLRGRWCGPFGPM